MNGIGLDLPTTMDPLLARKLLTTKPLGAENLINGDGSTTDLIGLGNKPMVRTTMDPLVARKLLTTAAIGNNNNNIAMTQSFSDYNSLQITENPLNNNPFIRTTDISEILEPSQPGMTNSELYNSFLNQNDNNQGTPLPILNLAPTLATETIDPAIYNMYDNDDYNLTPDIGNYADYTNNYNDLLDDDFGNYGNYDYNYEIDGLPTGLPPTSFTTEVDLSDLGSYDDYSISGSFQSTDSPSQMTIGQMTNIDAGIQNLGLQTTRAEFLQPTEQSLIFDLSENGISSTPDTFVLPTGASLTTTASPITSNNEIEKDPGNQLDMGGFLGMFNTVPDVSNPPNTQLETTDIPGQPTQPTLFTTANPRTTGFLTSRPVRTTKPTSSNFQQTPSSILGSGMLTGTALLGSAPVDNLYNNYDNYDYDSFGLNTAQPSGTFANIDLVRIL